MRRLTRYLFATILALMIVGLPLTEASTPLVNKAHIMTFGLVLGGIGFTVYGYQVYGIDGRFGVLLTTYLLSMMVLIGVAFRVTGGGFPNPGRAAKLTLIGMLLLFFITICPRQYQYLRRTRIFLLAFVVLFWSYLLDAIPLVLPNSIDSAAFFIITSVLLALNLFIIPRYVSRNAFLWIVSFFASGMVLLGIQAYSGAFSFFGLTVTVRDFTFTPIFTNMKIYALTSIFENPNMMGIVGFAGTVSAAVLATELFPRREQTTNRHPMRADGGTATASSFPFVVSIGLSCIAGLLFVINAFGLYLTNSRASYLAAAVALCLYGVYLVFGRRSLPYAVVGLLVGVPLLLFTLLALGISFTGRLDLWSAAIEAAFDDNLLFGYGYTNPPQDVINPYLPGDSNYSVHNAYLKILIEVGVVGLVAYLVLTVGSLFRGVFQSDTVDVPALVLVFGFAVNQFFETYTLFRNSIAAILASLAVGYLIMNGTWMDVAEKEEEDRSKRPRPERKTSSKTWTRPEWRR